MKPLFGALIVLLVAAAACSSEAADEPARSVDVLGVYRDSSADSFAASMEAFTEATGIEVNYLGTSDLANDLKTALSTGAPPDVALIPQPGLVAELATRADGILPLPEEVKQVLEANLPEDAIRIATFDDELYGVLYKISPKSLVWYSPGYFAANEISPPEDMAELVALVEELESQISPWCFTTFAFAATGWVVTDWIEDLLLRQAGTEAYAAWVEGELDFDSPEVRLAMETFERLVLEQGRAYGGPARYLRNPVAAAQLPMFDEPTNCVLHRQAGFAEDWLPSRVRPGEGLDTDVFLLPPEQKGDESRMLIGGETAVMFDDSPEIRELMSYLATPESGAVWAQSGGYTGVHTTVEDLEAYYPDPFDRKLAELVGEADVLAFDGSDLMPASFAGSTLLQTLTSWISGEISLDKAVADLDEERNKTAAS